VTFFVPQVAIPFGICVDFDSLNEPHTATLRERDSMLQVRMPVDDLPQVIRKLVISKLTWEEVLNTYARFEQQEATKK
jgi:glycyl-tRNA synthetase